VVRTGSINSGRKKAVGMVLGVSSILVIILLVGIIALGLWALNMLFPRVKYPPDSPSDRDDSVQTRNRLHHPRS
jgi:hypothetical protein